MVKHLWDKLSDHRDADDAREYQGVRITPNVYTTLEEIDIFAEQWNASPATACRRPREVPRRRRRRSILLEIDAEALRHPVERSPIDAQQLGAARAVAADRVEHVVR